MKIVDPIAKHAPPILEVSRWSAMVAIGRVHALKSLLKHKLEVNFDALSKFEGLMCTFHPIADMNAERFLQARS